MLCQKQIERKIRSDLKNLLRKVFKKYNKLRITTNWQVLEKTYGEVGGRFLEDFLLSELNANLPSNNIVGAYPPDGRRTMEDIKAEWEMSNWSCPKQKLLISIKGHRAHSASNPNLVSLQKAKSFYSNHPDNTHFILLVLDYLPERIEKNGFHITIQDVRVYHLKDLDAKHLSLQTIGAGGQFLLRGIEDMKETYRTPQQFYGLVCRKESSWRKKRRRRTRMWKTREQKPEHKVD